MENLNSAAEESKVRVAVRIRPQTASEALGEAAEVVHPLSASNHGISSLSSSDGEGQGRGGIIPLPVAVSTSLSVGGPEVFIYGQPATRRQFTFDYVFGKDSTQHTVYSTCVLPLVDKFVAGYNATVFAYGQTGSGKTYSMGTGLDETGDEDRGIVPRVIESILEKLESKPSHIFKYNLSVSFLELYNEDLVDLLNPARPRTANSSFSSSNSSSAAAGGGGGGWGGLAIREDGNGNIVWNGVREEPVHNQQEIMNCLQKGSLYRSTGSTDMNASSSRSHAIFSILLKQEKWISTSEEVDSNSNAMHDTSSSNNNSIPCTSTSASTTAFASSSSDTTTSNSSSSSSSSLLKDQNTSNSSTSSTTASSGSWQVLHSKFHFVDLAGSERLKRTNALGDRKREAISINQGLLSLGNVISALGDETRKSSYIPYRDSKLTRLLQDSLGGNSQTLMLSCVSPSSTDYAETLNTLNYANRARNIKNKVTLNGLYGNNNNTGLGANGERELIGLRNLVTKLQLEIAEMRSNPASLSSSSSSSSSPYHHHYVSSSSSVSASSTSALEISTLKRQLNAKSFEVDKFQFFNARLMERCRQLGRDLADVCSQRDAAVVESSISAQRQQQQLQQVQPVQNVTDSASSFPSATSSQSLSPHLPHHHHPIILHHLKIISETRLKLAETEDKLAWYKTVFGKLSNSTSSSASSKKISIPPPPSSSSRHENNTLDYTHIQPFLEHENMNDFEQPQNPRISSLLNIGELDVLHERNFIKVLKHDPELRRALSLLNSKQQSSVAGVVVSDTGSSMNAAALPRFYGLPSQLSTTFKSSPLAAEPPISAYSDDNGTDCEEDEGDAQDRETDELEEEEEEEDGDDSLSPTHHSRSSSSIYLLVDKIQSDIAEHENLVARLKKSETEYEAMKGAFDQKLNVLQIQMGQVKSERDLALQKLKDGGALQPKDKAGTMAIKTRYDKQHKKLETEISELRRKLSMRTNTKSQNENLIKTLMSTIQSLKAEKTMMTKKLKMEADKSKWYAVSKEKELSRLKKKERQISDAVKKLERNSQIQKIMMKRRSRDFGSSSDKLKNVFSILKRTGSLSSSSSSLNNRHHNIRSTKSASSTPRGQAPKRGASATTPAAVDTKIPRRPMTTPSDFSTQNIYQHDLFSLASSGNTASGVDNIISNDDMFPPLEVRAQFKRQMLEKELAECIKSRSNIFRLDELRQNRERLLGEQKELVFEREKWVQIEASTNINNGDDADAQRYYMDDRLDMIEEELTLLDSQIIDAENVAAVTSSSGCDGDASFSSTLSSDFTNSEAWENAVNLLRSLDPMELRIVSQQYLSEAVHLRLSNLDLDIRLADGERRINDLKTALEIVRAAALENSIEFEERIEEMHSRQSSETLAGLPTTVSSCSSETQDKAALAAAVVREAMVIGVGVPADRELPDQESTLIIPADGGKATINDMKMSIRLARDKVNKLDREIDTSNNLINLGDSATLPMPPVLPESNQHHQESASERLMRLLKKKSFEKKAALSSSTSTSSTAAIMTKSSSEDGICYAAAAMGGQYSFVTPSQSLSDISSLLSTEHEISGNPVVGIPTNTSNVDPDFSTSSKLLPLEAVTGTASEAAPLVKSSFINIFERLSSKHTASSQAKMIKVHASKNCTAVALAAEDL